MHANAPAAEVGSAPVPRPKGRASRARRRPTRSANLMRSLAKAFEAELGGAPSPAARRTVERHHAGVETPKKLCYFSKGSLKMLAKVANEVAIVEVLG
jgi:hypothetical protein